MGRVALSILLLFSGTAFAEDPHSQALKNLLYQAHIGHQSALHAEVAKELLAHPDLITLLDAGKTEEAAKYVRTILLSEVHLAVQNPSYPATRFAALYPFIELEAKSENAVADVQYAMKKLAPKYVSQFNENFQLTMDALEEGSNELIYPEKVMKNLGKKPFAEQIKTFEAAFTKNSTNNSLHQAYVDWYNQFIQDPAKESKKFLQFYDALTPSSPLSRLNNNPLAMGVKKLHEIDALAKSKPKTLLDKTIRAPYYHRVESMLKHIENNNSHLAARDRIYISYAAKNRANQEQMFKYLNQAPSWYKGQTHTVDELPQLLDLSKVSMAPDSKSEFDITLRHHFETGKVKKIGPTMFAKLIEENPELAERYTDYFFKNEFIPAYLGHREDAIVAPYLLKGENTANLEPSINKILKYLKESAPSELKHYAQGIAISVPVTHEKYSYDQKMPELLSLLNEKEHPLEAGRMIFHSAPIHEIETNPKYRDLVKQYLSWVTETPERLTQEIIHGTEISANYDRRRLFTYFGENKKSAAKIFLGDPKGLKRFTETYLSTIPYFTEEALRGKGLFSSSYERVPAFYGVLKDYAAYTDATPEQTAKFHNLLQNKLVKELQFSYTGEKKIQEWATDWKQHSDKAASMKAKYGPESRSCLLNILSTITNQ